MLFWEKLKETIISVAPIMALVLLLHCTIAPLGDTLGKFLVGGVCLIIGLSIFLVGAEIGVLPMGQKVGSELTNRRSLPLMLGVGFVIGFFITVAEPDVQVLASQVAQVDPAISRQLLVGMIAVGVGLFVAVALSRIVLQISFKAMLLGFYLILFACAYFTNPAFLGIAFDAGGATTGPMTVPFIMALGVGVAAVRGGSNSGDDSFGLIGLASIGPVMAVLILGMIFTGSGVEGGALDESAAVQETVVLSLGEHFMHLVPEVLAEVTQALGPLIVLFAIFQCTLCHMSPYQVRRLIKGLIYTFIGLVFFFVGVKGGFMTTGTVLAGLIAEQYTFILIPLGLVFGAVVVCAEPAVWVLNSQVEEVSGGHIKKKVMLVTLCVGVAIAVAIAMLRVITGLSIWYFLIPGYALALGMTRICPQMFTAIAFDSGGVASGPMASTFILAFTLGASEALGGNPITDAFGVIAMIAMTPLIAIQVLGILFHRKQLAAERHKARQAQCAPQTADSPREDKA